MKRALKIAVALLLVLVLILGCSKSTDKKVRYPLGKMRIDYLGAPDNFVFQGTYVEASIYLDTLYPEELFDFNILIGFNDSAIDLTEVIPGDILDCWEKFDYDFITPPENISPQPGALLRISGNIGDMQGGICESRIHSFPTEIVKLNFFTSYEREFNCTLQELYFVWLECDDNCVNVTEGNDPHYAGAVYYIESNSQNYTYKMLIPSDGIIDDDDYLYGIPENCNLQISLTPPYTIRNLNFYDGALSIACASVIDAYPGDLDLDGEWYEQDDIDLMCDYQLMGEAAFTIDPVQQKKNAELAGDQTINLSDLYAMILTSNNEYKVNPPLDYNPSLVSVQSESGQVYITNEVDVACIFLVFDNNVPVSVVLDPMNVRFWDGDGKTHVLIYDLDGELIAPGAKKIATFNGEADIESIEMIDKYGLYLKTIILE